MMLLSSLAAAFILLLLALLLTGAGKRVLSFLAIDFASPLESLLFSVTLGAIALELAVTAGELAPNVRYGVIGATVVVALGGFAGMREVLRDLRALRKILAALAKFERLLAFALLGVLALDGLAALAPVTGSDALHYHFPSQRFYLEYGFRAEWSLLQGFYDGLGHKLILTGLAFGSDKLATGLIFLGGATATLATLLLARQFVAGAWPFAVALVFALTPVTFWQMTSAGAPDIWMCALLPLGLLAVLHASRRQNLPAYLLAGILAGAIAGSKYTGILMAGALFVAFAIELRSLQKCLVFFSAAVAVGAWPYLRNWIWTGDPVFPFLLARHPGATANFDALGAFLRDTGASNPHPLARVIWFPLFATTNHGYETWALLGPLVLALGPIALLSVRRTPLWRTVLIVWLMVSLGIGKTSGIPRFLLPILPVALAASVGGVVLLTQQRFKWLRSVTTLSVAASCLAGFAALLVYSWPAWSVGIGLVSPDAYLRLHAPDYMLSQFVNTQIELLSAGDHSQRALLFFRHVYYVRAPFLNGGPEDNWDANPDLLRSDQAWLQFFSQQQVRWIVKAPNYPPEFSQSLTRLESEGVLKTCASGSVEAIQGFRVNGKMGDEPVSILCVQR